ECNSNRDSVLSYTSVRSNSSYLGSDEMGSEFRQTEDWTARSRFVIHKNIQEDPWNLPHSIKNLVESLQRFVDEGLCSYRRFAKWFIHHSQYMPCDIKGYIPAHCFPQCISSLEHLCLCFVAYIFSISSVFSRPPSSTIDTSLQLRRDVIFCQAATGALCTLAEQLLTALRSRFNNAGEYQEDSKETSRKWLEQISVIGVLLHFQSTLAPHLSFFSLLWQKAERTMLEDTKAALLDLDKVTVFFRPLEDECLVASLFVPIMWLYYYRCPIIYDTLEMVLFKFCGYRILRSCSRLLLQAKCFLFCFPALERPEGVSPQEYVDMEEFQQRINAVSLEKVKAYYRRLRYAALHSIRAPQWDPHHSSLFFPPGKTVCLMHKNI
ncbi:hypothetical protein GOODEAATRI_012560, partial [Goodea atripinnis]